MALDKIIIEGDEILQLIPQRPPMVMVDKLLLYEKKRNISGLCIKENNIFVENGVFQESGLTENIAQTAALHTGYTCMQEKKAVPIGFIGAIKNLVIYSLPKIGSEIQTEIIIENEIFDFTLITGKITCNSETIAECEMKIFIKK
jgi:predicted hotdog family 3-hydroxylacyl-ACP dehydratase